MHAWNLLFLRATVCQCFARIVMEAHIKDCVLCLNVKYQQNFREYSLLGTIYELVLIRPFIARLHTFILPKAFGVLIELLRWGASERGRQRSVTNLC